MTRTEFLDRVSMAVALASRGSVHQGMDKLIARYRRLMDAETDQWIHRFDVRADGNAYYVAGMTGNQQVTVEEARTMLKAVEQFLGPTVKVQYE